LYTVDQTAIRQLKLSVNKGVLVTQVSSGSPADGAGIKQYDVITGIDGKDVATVNDLIKTIRSDKVGQTVQVTYWRTSSQNTVSVTLVKAPTG
jgi:serine protease Do